MLSWLMKTVVSCWSPGRRYDRMNDDGDYTDDLLWSKDICQHSAGDFSVAVIQANSLLEDHSQVETGPHGTFVGVYDGHGGPETAQFICDHLFLHLQRFAREEGCISDEVLRKAFVATEEGFVAVVTRSWDTKPLLAAVGSCCLVGVIWGETLYIANLGDSRAVLGCLLGSNGKITAVQLTTDHNARIEEVRQELKELHPDDSHIVVYRHGGWRVKGIIQVSRSIGDLYLKKPEFNLDHLKTRFQLSEPLQKPALTAEPSIYSQVIKPHDKFLIFASDGLWEYLSNQEAVEIVHNNPRAGIARRLIGAALHEAAKKREIQCSDIKKVERGIRRHVHDDITVVVLFLDHEFRGRNIPPLSVRGAVDAVTAPSDFFLVHGRNMSHNVAA